MMDMTNDAIKTIQEMAVEAAGKKIIKDNGLSYYIDEDGDVTSLIPRNLAQDAVQLTSLTGLVDFAKSIKEREGDNYMSTSNLIKKSSYIRI
jgi:hypothetical protein